MGKLNIAHHKSYHPYRRDNIERVRRDEEEARQQEAVQEGRMMLAVCGRMSFRLSLSLRYFCHAQDSEARIDLLRQRAGAHSAYSRHDDDDHGLPQAGLSSISLGGHINLFEDLERVSSRILLPPHGIKICLLFNSSQCRYRYARARNRRPQKRKKVFL